MSKNSGNIDLSGKVALVTGASRGIGRAVALGYAQAGAHVIAVARTTGALEELDDEIQAAGGEQATLMPLDIRDFDKLDMLGPALAEKFGKLDIFVGNAAMQGTLTPIPHMDAKEWQRVMDVNLNANFRLLRTLDPLLRKSDAGRVIFVSSRMADKCDAYKAFYAVSKAALNALLKCYAAETEKTNIRANLIRPGFVETKMLEEAYPGGYQGKTKKPEDVTPAFLELASSACEHHGEFIDLYDEQKAA